MTGLLAQPPLPGAAPGSPVATDGMQTRLPEDTRS